MIDNEFALTPAEYAHTRHTLTVLSNDQLATVLQTMAEYDDHPDIADSYDCRLFAALIELGYIDAR